jgi:hypothetical protein
MWTDHNEREIQVLLVKNKIITDKKQKNIKDCIHTSTGGIPVGGLVKKPSEKRIKKIKNIVNQWFQRKNS